MGESLWGLPTWLWVLLMVAFVLAVFFWSRHRSRVTARDRSEALAQRADATHEGPQTRHEGGA